MKNNGKVCTCRENKRLHLSMIQDVISRMGSNSFFIKGWALTAIGGLITLFFTHASYSWSRYLIILALIICVMFWILDAFYLQKERKFRVLFNIVRTINEEKIDFCMSTNLKQIRDNKKAKFYSCFFSSMLFVTYGITALMLICIYIAML